ncbi:MAG TPA: hypothetical protein VLC52_09805 [Anaerolineae bacterium]|nr:hypothetical protein [Anaerolineae bacterium]
MPSPTAMMFHLAILGHASRWKQKSAAAWFIFLLAHAGYSPKTSSLTTKLVETALVTVPVILVMIAPTTLTAQA